MSVNFLEQLISEWYEYQGYFVRRNILVGKREKGGYECELDVVAYNPREKHLIHIEPSTDADSWAIREKRFCKKFEAGRRYVHKIFQGFDLPQKIEQVTILVFASKQNHETLGGGKLILASDVLVEIFQDLKTKHLASNAIPEQLSILRSFQFVSEYSKSVMRIWES